MNGLDLFSGIGGLTKALDGYVRPVAYCEIESYARGVLLSRMADGSLPSAPVWDDIRSLTADVLPQIDIMYGGFPCQDISAAGRGAGLDGKRSGLFYEILRLAQETKSPFIFLENVARIRTRGMDRVIAGLTQAGYDCRWGIITARAVGGQFDGKRWFLLAKARCARLEGIHETRGGEHLQPTSGDVRAHWQTEPGVDRVAYGLPAQVDRLRGLGNSVVPAQAREAFERLMGLKA